EEDHCWEEVEEDPEARLHSSPLLTARRGEDRLRLSRANPLDAAALPPAFVLLKGPFSQLGHRPRAVRRAALGGAEELERLEERPPFVPRPVACTDVEGEPRDLTVERRTPGRSRSGGP